MEERDSYNTHFDLVDRCEKINSKLDTFLVYFVQQRLGADFYFH